MGSTRIGADVTTARIPSSAAYQSPPGRELPHPWDTGDIERNWQGYFVPGTGILRNRVGARTADELRDAENDLVETRLIELREDPNLVGQRSYDLDYLQRIHQHLFQDVYEWAGELRTVGIEKGGESFCPPPTSAG